MFLGSCGACSGVSSYEGISPQAQLAQRERLEAAGMDEGTVDVQVLLSNDPRRQPLAVANVAVSLLLLIAANALLFRRSWAPWFAQQIAGAKVLLATATAASALVYWYGIRAEIVPFFEAEGLPPGSDGFVFVSLTIAAGVQVLFSAILYAFLAWRVGRGDVREFMTPPTDSR